MCVAWMLVRSVVKMLGICVAKMLMCAAKMLVMCVVKILEGCVWLKCFGYVWLRCWGYVCCKVVGSTYTTWDTVCRLHHSQTCTFSTEKMLKIAHFIRGRPARSNHLCLIKKTYPRYIK
jgi:hypothetical protein